MSEKIKKLNEHYDDVDLCYKVLGLSFSDPPEKVDNVCHGLMAEYNNSLRSSDPAIRQDAKRNLEQVQDLYERITSSLIYKDYVREYEKFRLLKGEEKQVRKQKLEGEKAVLFNCPYCRKLLSPKLKVCIYCQGKILSPMNRLMQKVFCTRNMVVASIVVVLIVVGAILALNPQLLNIR